MNQRLLQFLAAENLSQSQFADLIGVARASVSHIIAGRNKPGFDFIENMSRNFPSLNLEWLITGKGRMYKSADSPVVAQPIEPQSDTIIELSPAPVAAAPKETKATQRKRSISKIIVFFDDGSFQELQ